MSWSPGNTSRNSWSQRRKQESDDCRQAKLFMKIYDYNISMSQWIFSDPPLTKGHGLCLLNYGCMHFIYSFAGFPSAIAFLTAQNHWENSANTQWQVYSFWLDKHIQIPVCVCVHVRQADYDYRLFIPLLFATKTHVARGRVFGLVLIPCLQLISHDFIHVYSQEKLFNAFKCKQASDESTQTPPNTHRYV